MRTRFAPSPTGNVHIGNIRVAIFNWLYARNQGGEFLIRVEDTDLERSTPEAIRKMFDALQWLGMDYDGEPMYQTARREAHEQAAQKILQDGNAYKPAPDMPVYLKIGQNLFDPSFVSEPKDEARLKWEKGELAANRQTIIHRVTSPKDGTVYTTPVNWDALSEPVLLYEDGSQEDALPVREKLGNDEVDLNGVAGKKITGMVFRRRYVFFDDLVLGRCEKPLDSLRDLVIVRSDGSPVFHLANVLDDHEQQVTHILRGNDHVENTFRHLFILKALGLTPPQYGHFPMIVNAKGKPYSKRDGDAYVGDFQQKGFLPEALFNFLALCGWSSGDDREIMSREEMVQAFSLERVNASAAQFDLQKLQWMNQQYLQNMPEEKLQALLKDELVSAGVDVSGMDGDWFARLVQTQRERISFCADFISNTHYFFSGDFEFNEKAVKKNLLKNEGQGLQTLAMLKDVLSGVAEWKDEVIDKVLHDFGEEKELKMGLVAQPLRVACTGNTVSPGIGETLELIGKDEVIARIERTLCEITV